MNAQELHQSAPRLSESNRAYVLFKNDDRGIIIPPGIGIGIDILLALGVGRSHGMGRF